MFEMVTAGPLQPVQCSLQACCHGAVCAASHRQGTILSACLRANRWSHSVTFWTLASPTLDAWRKLHLVSTWRDFATIKGRWRCSESSLRLLRDGQHERQVAWLCWLTGERAGDNDTLKVTNTQKIYEKYVRFSSFFFFFFLHLFAVQSGYFIFCEFPRHFSDTPPYGCVWKTTSWECKTLQSYLRGFSK